MQHATSVCLFPRPICYAFNLLIHLLAVQSVAERERERRKIKRAEQGERGLEEPLHFALWQRLQQVQQAKLELPHMHSAPTPLLVDTNARAHTRTHRHAPVHTLAHTYAVFDFVCFNCFHFSIYSFSTQFEMKNGKTLFIFSANSSPHTNTHTCT